MPIKPLEDLLYYLFPQREDGSLVTSGSATVLLAYGVLALLACVGLVALLIQQVTKKRSRNADPPASDGPTLTKVRTTKDPQGSELASPSGGSPLSASGLPTPAGPSGPAPYVPIFTVRAAACFPRVVIISYTCTCPQTANVHCVLVFTRTIHRSTSTSRHSHTNCHPHHIHTQTTARGQSVGRQGPGPRPH